MPSPPISPTTTSPRPMSAIARPSRSSSRMSMGSRQGGNYAATATGNSAPSRLSDEDASSKTSVKVVVRVRPPLRNGDPGYDLIPQRFQRSMAQVTSPTSLAVDSPQGRKIFVFDKVFGPEVDQNGVWEYLGESVNAFLQGYNVSLLAYGQSGSGKSYSMGMSDPKDQADTKVMGVIPRAAAALFESLNAPSREPKSSLKAPTRYSTSIPPSSKINGTPDKTWTLKATYVEIYNEQLRDLLLPEATSDRRQVSIREDTKGRILLTGLTEIAINSIDDLLNALNFGSSIRQTDATAINAKSSRSHAVFSLNLVQRRPKGSSGKVIIEKRHSAPIDFLSQANNDFVTVDSKFHFVDLAGSERLKNTGALGDRAKEGISINAGLASLGKVISQLSSSSRQAGSHVSYRDSKLTRLLQDSLGGNAITYMVACVTPAEFHLSETLNTVQYAQRARAIQSKPRIQEVSLESDMKALVDRLRAEISFLREQVQNSNRGTDSDLKSPTDRSQRSNEKEIDLQNQLLDIQENYSALSQRHAKLISEITKGRDADADATSTLEVSHNAVERLARSNSFAEAVEQVVLEYEKTIQSLEISLSSTRSTLASTESSLMEKETKLAYAETINAQLSARLQKLQDRESSTETYLHDLEIKLDGQSTGEEKNMAVITELRRELTRVKENEAGCEDYISTLEERLAESEQDMETMQREVDRLEHIIERQRSLGKLDNLLHELDSLANEPKTTNGEPVAKDPMSTPEITREVAHGDEVEETKAPMVDIIPDDTLMVNGDSTTLGQRIKDVVDVPYPQIDEPSPIEETNQAHDPVGDKLELVTQELVGLKVEHENTVNEFAEMTMRYEAALRELHEMQDQLDEQQRSTRSPTPGMFPEPTVHFNHESSMSGSTARDMRDHEEQFASKPLSSELSLAGESADAFTANRASTQSIGKHDSMSEIDRGEDVEELLENHRVLQEEHQATLELVEELKADISKARMNGVVSPTGNQVLRRKSSQNVMLMDRANRSFKGLKNIANQYLDGNEDAMEVFDLNLNGALHELQTRSDRIVELETEVTGLRKDVEIKAAMITGLARERSSINHSPMDISVVASLQSRLAESEVDLQRLRMKSASREKDLINELQQYKSLLDAQNESQREMAHTNGIISHEKALPSVPADTLVNGNMSLAGDSDREVQQAQEAQELESLLLRLDVAMKAKIETEALFVREQQASIKATSDVKALESELETVRLTSSTQALRMTEMEQSLMEAGILLEALEEDRKRAEAERLKLVELNEKLGSENDRHLDTIDKHESAIGKHVSTIGQQNATMTELRELHGMSQKDLEDLTRKESKHAEMIDELEQQLATTYDQHQETSKRLDLVTVEMDSIRKDREVLFTEAQSASKEARELVENLTAEITALQTKLADTQVELAATAPGGGARAQRSNSVSSMNLRKSSSNVSLPSPPPAIPLPPLPSNTANSSSAVQPPTPTMSRRPSKDYVATHIEDQEARIKTLEKQLQAEKALTSTLEEALTDCEKTMKKLSVDKESLQMKASQAQQELDRTRNESQTGRYSMQAVEDERVARLRAEKAKEALEERMQALSNKKKGRKLACF